MIFCMSWVLLYHAGFETDTNSLKNNIVPFLNAQRKWLCCLNKNVWLILSQQTRIVMVAISIATTTICICYHNSTITVVSVTSDVIATTILVCWGYIHKTCCWGNNVIFSVGVGRRRVLAARTSLNASSAERKRPSGSVSFKSHTFHVSCPVTSPRRAERVARHPT